MTTEELQVIISAQIEDLSKKLEKAQKETKTFSTKSGKNFEAFKKGVAAVGKATAAAMKATATALTAGGAALVGLSESTKEYRVAQAKLVSAFETAGSSAEQAKTTYNELYRVLGDSDTAVEAANHLATLTTEEEALAEYTKICQGVYAKFGDSLAVEGLTEAINHTAKLGEVQGTLADALEWSGVSVDDFNAQLFMCNSEAEREALIRDTLNGLYSESAENYEKNASGILAANEAQAKLTESLATLGAMAEPIVTIFKAGLADALATLTPHIGTVAEGLQMMFNGDTAGGAAKMEEGISGLVDSLLTMITDMLPNLLKIGVSIITSLLEGIVKAFPSIITTLLELLPTIIQTIINLVPQITGALLAALPLLLETLLQLVTQILVGLAEMLPTVVQQIVDTIPLICNALVENYPLLIEAAVQLLMAIVEGIPEIIPPLIAAIPQLIQTLVDTLLEFIPDIIQAAIDLLMAIVDTLPTLIPTLIDGALTLFFAIVDAIPMIIPPLLKALPGIVDKLIGTLIDNIPTLLAGAVKLFMAIVQAIPKILPDLIKALGSLIGSALSNIGNLFKKVGTVIGDAIGGTVKKAIQGVLSNAIKIINGFIKAINLAIGLINKIPGVNIKKLNELEVPKLARGGVVDSATMAVIGERGTEAVVPLENNLEWLDKLAGMLTERLGGAGGNQPIYLMVDKKVLAETAYQGINNITRQTGKMPLILV